MTFERSHFGAEKQKETTARAKEALAKAREAWRAGDYAVVKRTLADLELDYVEPEISAEAAFLLDSSRRKSRRHRSHSSITTTTDVGNHSVRGWLLI